MFMLLIFYFLLLLLLPPPTITPSPPIPHQWHETKELGGGGHTLHFLSYFIIHYNLWPGAVTVGKRRKQQWLVVRGALCTQAKAYFGKQYE